ncbi:hypothetical protein ACEWY4_020177 [Coilia grayii]|uniref:TOG domain-containing protein n=1 Tax=Coilia grayii TaxID=363190 RepID=A0ABD1JC61_9TELE
MQCSFLLPTQREVLPPIGSTQQQQPSGVLQAASSSSLPVIQDVPALPPRLLGDRVPSECPVTLKQGAPRRPGRKGWTGLDHAPPLKPVLHRRAPKGVTNGSSISLLPAPPSVAEAISEAKLAKYIEEQEKLKCLLEPLRRWWEVVEIKQRVTQEALRVAEEMKLSGLGDSDALESVPDSSPSSASSLSPVDLRTPSVLRALPFLNTPSPPTVPTVPAPPQTAKPQTTNGGAFRSRLPRLKKTASLRVATAVKEQTSVETLAERNEGVREHKEVKKERVREEKQPRETGSQKTRDLPELARLPSVSFPEQTFVHALRLLNNEDWAKKVEALTSIRSLSQHHAEVLLPRLHELCLAIIQEVKNLRSAVSRTAMVTLAYLYAHLGRDMDAQVEITARALLQKLCEAKGFIREDAELALRHMVASVSPSRSLTALTNTGVRSRCTAVRKSTAQLLGRLVEAVGSSRLLSGRREVTDRFIHAVSCLALDCALEVRTNARKCLTLMVSHPDLIKMVERYAPEGDLVAMKDIINKCQSR